MNKLAFFGPMCSGKTWCADYLVQEHGYTKVAFASKLKHIALDLFGVVGKDGRDREILQQLGTKMREIKSDVWIDYLLRFTNSPWVGSDPNLVLDDLRYVNEAKALKDNGWTLVLVTVPGVIREARIARLYPDTSASAITHASEQEWKDIPYDFAVESYTAEDTKAQLKHLLKMQNILVGKF